MKELFAVLGAGPILGPGSFESEMIDHGVFLLYPALVLGFVLSWVLYRNTKKYSYSNTFSGHSIYPSSVSSVGFGEIGLLFLIVAGGFLIRWWGLSFGFPANFHPDEIPKLNAIERMRGAGDLNPRYFLHPSLLLYATHFTQKLGSFAGIWDNSRESLNLAGRVVSLFAGTLTIPGIWVIGRWLSGRWSIGILGAALLAVAPLHVTCSRYLKEDALVTFWMVVTAAIVAIVVGSAQPERRRWWLLLAGLTAGIAAGSKYTGLVFGAFVGITPWLISRSWRPASLFIPPVFGAACAAALGFLICTPYALLDWSTFISDFMYEKRHMKGGHMVVITPWDHWWAFHIGRSLVPGWGIIAATVSLIGVGAAVFFALVRRERLAIIILLGLLLTYIPAEMVNAKPEPQPDRYLVVCMPWFALAAAWVLIQIRSIRNKRFASTIGSAAIALVLLAPLTRSLQLGMDLHHDTRDEMAGWISEHIPAGSKIAVDYQWYGPPLDPTQYNVTSLHGGQILERIRIGELRRAGFDYVIVSSFFKDRFFRQADRLGHLRELFRRIEQELPVVHRTDAPMGPYGFHNPGLVLYSLQNSSKP